jgi:hypothetical protein
LETVTSPATVSSHGRTGTARRAESVFICGSGGGGECDHEQSDRGDARPAATRGRRAMVTHGVQHDRGGCNDRRRSRKSDRNDVDVSDGLDEHITPSSVRHKQPTTRLPEGGITNWTGHGTTRRVDSLPEFFDVLIVGRPTDSPRWIELTAPGDHSHPDYPGPRPVGST